MAVATPTDDATKHRTTPVRASTRAGLDSPIPVGVFGASGTSGTVLVGLLHDHPAMDLRFATSRSMAGRVLSDVDPSAPRVPLVDADDVDMTGIDLVFTCLPHRASAPKVAEARAAGARVVDLSGDFRLADPAVHDAVYGSFRDADLARDAVYGMTELARERVDDADLVANPGCYPTCTTMGLAPLVRRGWVEGPVVVDAKSGVSGAGRSPKTGTLFIAVTDDVKPYKLGRSHRHVAEIEQMFARLTPDGSNPPGVIFNPHVVPIERGMLATSVVHCPGRNRDEILAAIAEDYADEPLVDVLEEGAARVRAVARTPRAQVGVAEAGNDRFVVTSTLDNLGKGAATQALQNANRMFGLPETLGLLPDTAVPTLQEKTR